jgi:hypothetical protein
MRAVLFPSPGITGFTTIPYPHESILNTMAPMAYISVKVRKNEVARNTTKPNDRLKESAAPEVRALAYIILDLNKP